MNVDNPLALYRQMVKRVIEEKLSTRIDNSSDEHAIVLIDELVRHAKHQIDIYCKSFSADVWGSGDVFDAIKHAVEKKVKFRVLTQLPVEDSETFKFLQGSGVAIFKLYLADAIDINFMVIDGEMFRIEPCNKERKGFAYAKNQEASKVLSDAFVKMWTINIEPQSIDSKK